jgi:hypothetical protein
MEASFNMTFMYVCLATLYCVVWKNDKWKVNFQGCEWKRLLPIMRRYHVICVEGLKSTTENLIQVSWSSDRNVNMRLSEYLSSLPRDLCRVTDVNSEHDSTRAVGSPAPPPVAPLLLLLSVPFLLSRGGAVWGGCRNICGCLCQLLLDSWAATDKRSC